jgi:hypothetical protein
VQIFVQSKRLDIRPYIALLEGQYKEQTIELMKIQTREYIEFIKTFVDNSSIMTKSFFVVIPYSPTTINKNSNPLSGVSGLFSARKNTPAQKTAQTNTEFEEYRSQLEQRTGVVEQGLTRCGIRVAELGTEEVVELFYKIFNPGDTEKPIQIN